MAANFSISGMPSSSERTCAGWVRYAQYPSRSSTTYTAPYLNSPPSSGPTTYDFTAGLAAPAWRSSSTAARSCSLLRPALKVMRLMWKIMVFSFSVDFAVRPDHLPAKRPCGAGDHSDPIPAAELDRVRGVHVHVRENLQHVLHRRGVGDASIDRLSVAGNVRDHVCVVDRVDRREIAGVERVLPFLHEREQVCGSGGCVSHGRHVASFCFMCNGGGLRRSRWRAKSSGVGATPQGLDCWFRGHRGRSRRRGRIAEAHPCASLGGRTRRFCADFSRSRDENQRCDSGDHGTLTMP